MFGLDFRLFELGRLEKSQTQHLLGLLEHRDFAFLAVGYVGLLASDGRLDARFHFLHIDPHLAQHFVGRAVGFADDAEEQMLDADVSVFESYGLVAAVCDDLFAVFA